MEYHGKNIVDGHFRVLSRWFAEGEAVRYINTIEDLIDLFKSKTSTNMEFDIYSNTEPRSNIHKLIIDNFRSYMSFCKIDNRLYTSTISTLIDTDYIEVNYNIKIIGDKRKTKYTLEKNAVYVNVPTVIGIKNKKTLSTRVQLTQNIK